MLIRLGLDASQVQAGANQAEKAFKQVDTSAKQVARTGPMVSEKVTTLGNSMFMLAAANRSLSPALMLSVNALKAMDDAMRGMMTGVGAAIAILPAVAFIIYDWASNQGDLNDQLKETKKQVDLNVGALQTLVSTGSDYAESAQNAIEREKQRKFALLAQAEAALAAAEAINILTEFEYEHQLQTRAAAGDALAAIISQTSMALSTELNAQKQDELINKIATLRAALRELGATFEDEAKKGRKYKWWKPEELIPAGDALDEAQKTIRTEAPTKLTMPPVVGQSISRQITSGLFSAFDQGEQGFEDMLKRWASMLAESAVFALLLSIFNPGRSFGSFFASAFGFQHGTTMVPATGPYILHKGESVVPANQNIFNNTSRTTNAGFTLNGNIIVQGSMGDLRGLVREIEDMARARQTSIALAR